MFPKYKTNQVVRCIKLNHSDTSILLPDLSKMRFRNIAGTVVDRWGISSAVCDCSYAYRVLVTVDGKSTPTVFWECELTLFKAVDRGLIKWLSKK